MLSITDSVVPSLPWTDLEQLTCLLGLCDPHVSDKIIVCARKSIRILVRGFIYLFVIEFGFLGCRGCRSGPVMIFVTVNFVVCVWANLFFLEKLARGLSSGIPNAFK